MSNFVSEKQMDQMAEFLYGKIDLPFFHGSAEKIIFKGFVCTIVRAAEAAIPKEWVILFLSSNSGISEVQMAPLIGWLRNTINEHVRLPFVGEDELQEKLIMSIAVLLVSGMVKGRNLDSDMVFPSFLEEVDPGEKTSEANPDPGPATRSEIENESENQTDPPDPSEPKATDSHDVL